MAYNLSSLRGSPSFAGAGKFGSASLSGGVLNNSTADASLSATGANGGALTSGTVEAWVKAANDGSIRVAFGHAQWFWVGKDSSGNAQARYGSAVGETTLSSTTAIADNAWHHIALDLNSGAGSLYVDGTRVATSATTRSTGTPTTAAGFCVGGFGESGDSTTAFDWNGSVDDVRISTTRRYTGTTYTVPAAAHTDSTLDTAARALYHLDGNGTDTAQTASPVTINPNDTGILYSPYNWVVASGLAESINAGAYLKTIITGSPAAISLSFDMTNVSSPVPQIAYRVDHGPWTVAAVASSVSLTMPSGNAWTKHLIEVVVKSTTETVNRWNSTRNASVKLTGIVTDSITATAVKPTVRALRVLVFGDSITEGVRTLNSTASNDTDRNDAQQGWAWQLAESLGAEVGVVGFGGTGISTSGSGNVPALSTSYALMWSGTSRSFSTSPDLVVLNIGTNDGSTNTTTAMTGLLDALLSATTARIVVLRPFGGTAQAAYLQAAVAACTDPKRVTYVDTAGWWSSTDSSDGTHPYGYANVETLAPLVASAARTALARGATWINVGGVAKAASIIRR
jgi:lysophospholipase L1-like esterase